MAKSNLTVRLLTSAVAIPLLLGLLFRGPALGWALLIFVAAVVAAQELFAMTAPGDRITQAVGTLCTLAVAITIYFAGGNSRALLTLAISVPLVGFLTPLLRVKDIASSGLRLMTLAAGPWYIGGLLTTTSLLRRDFGAGWVLLVLSIAWLADTGGYFAGRRFGGAKLYPAVSPNKNLGWPLRRAHRQYSCGSCGFAHLSARAPVVAWPAAGTFGRSHRAIG